MDELPITAMGRVDRRALRDPLAIFIAAPNTPRATHTMEPWLRACGLAERVARTYSEQIEQQHRHGTEYPAKVWESLVLSALLTIVQLERLAIDEGSFCDELHRLGYLSHELRLELDVLRLERRRRAAPEPGALNDGRRD
jgi:hypothetical protein